MNNIIRLFIIGFMSINYLYSQDIEILNKEKLIENNFKLDLQLLLNLNPSQTGKTIFSETTDNISIVSIYVDGEKIEGAEFDDETFCEISKIGPNEKRIVKLSYSASSNGWILVAYDNTDLTLKMYIIPITAKCIKVSYRISYISEITEYGDYIIDHSKVFNQIFHLPL